MELENLNRCDQKLAEQQFLRCCASSCWAKAMTNRRPFTSKAEVFEQASAIWGALAEHDWIEAFAAHPKIGTLSKVSAWSSKEQSGMEKADATVRRNIAKLNDSYFDKFGFVFLICATGRSAEEMLAQLEQRIANSRSEEIQCAQREQDKITKIRLEKLLCED